VPLPRSHRPLSSFSNAHRRAAVPNNAPPTISKPSAPPRRFDLPLSRRAPARFQPSPPCSQTKGTTPKKDNGPEHVAARVRIRELGDDERGKVLHPHAALWYRLLRHRQSFLASSTSAAVTKTTRSRPANARRPHQNSAASSKENADAAISTSPRNEKTPDTACRKPEGYSWAVCSTHRSALYSQPKATAPRAPQR
jgi:hypothetical protein